MDEEEEMKKFEMEENDEKKKKKKNTLDKEALCERLTSHDQALYCIKRSKNQAAKRAGLREVT